MEVIQCISHVDKVALGVIAFWISPMIFILVKELINPFIQSVPERSILISSGQQLRILSSTFIPLSILKRSV